MVQREPSGAIEATSSALLGGRARRGPRTPPGAPRSRWDRIRAQWAAYMLVARVDCPWCGEPIDPAEPWHLDHRVPRSEGGTDLPENLHPMHARCNMRKGSSTPPPAPNERPAPPSRPW